MNAPTIVAALIAGLAAIPHCAAMCGPLAAASCATAKAGVRYQLGRIAGYSALGALVGAGGAVLIPILRAPWVGFVAAAGFAIAVMLAARDLWRGQGTSVSWRMPGRADERERKKDGPLGNARRRLPLAPEAMGAATAVLPCGALVAAAMLAASTLSAPGGAMTMATFAVGSSLGTLAGPVALAWLATRGMVARRVLATALGVMAMVTVVRAKSAFEEKAACCRSGADVSAE